MPRHETSHMTVRLGGLRVHELTVITVHRFLRAVAEHHGPATAKVCRSMLSGKPQTAYGKPTSPAARPADSPDTRSRPSKPAPAQ
jgi:hypothetical protein